MQKVFLFQRVHWKMAYAINIDMFIDMLDKYKLLQCSDRCNGSLAHCCFAASEISYWTNWIACLHPGLAVPETSTTTTSTHSFSVAIDNAWHHITALPYRYCQLHSFNWPSHKCFQIIAFLRTFVSVRVNPVQQANIFASFLLLRHFIAVHKTL